MRAIVIIAFALVAATASPAAAVLTPPVTPPTSSFVRPERVYVLPVVWIPSENAGTYSTPNVQKAKNNLAVHLRTAQRKYTEMLRNLVTGDNRGTFMLATWDAGTNTARMYGELFNTLEPLVVQSRNTYASMTDMEILGEVLTAADCKVTSCPFVFVILVHHQDDDDGDDDIYAVPFNHGFNGGGGFVRIPLDVAKNAASLFPGTASNVLLSSVIHELGHAFGLSHLDAVYGGDPLTHTLPPGCMSTQTCPLSAYDTWCNAMPWSRERLEFHCSPSIMSYSKRNQTSGCLATDGAGTCTMPTAAQIATIPGILISENLNNLARNTLVFPELAADFDLLIDDDDGDGMVRWHPGFNFPDNPANNIPGHPQIWVAASHSDLSSQARFTFGQNWRSIPALGESFHGWRHWRSLQVASGIWVNLTFTFPEDVQLGRVRVYTGLDGGTHRATEIKVADGPVGGSLTHCAQASLGGQPDGDLGLYSWCGPSRVHRVFFRAGSSGRVVVRMIRFFDTDGNEIHAPAEPVASSGFTHTGSYATDPDNVVGGNQVILDYTSGWSGDRMWHSRSVDTAGEWIPFDVRLPEQLPLTSVVVYTGHSGYYHRADRVQVWLRDENAAYVIRGDSYTTSAPVATVNLSATPARHVRIWLRSTTSPATKHVVIRGIRFFTAQGEVFVPRSGYSGIAPVL